MHSGIGVFVPLAFAAHKISFMVRGGGGGGSEIDRFYSVLGRLAGLRLDELVVAHASGRIARLGGPGIVSIHACVQGVVLT